MKIPTDKAIPTWDLMTDEEREEYAKQDYCSHGRLIYLGDLRNEFDLNNIPEEAADIFKECADQFSGSVNFQCLSETQNRALTLFYLENMSYEEIALDLGISVSGVRMSMVRARKKLVTVYRNSRDEIKKYNSKGSMSKNGHEAVNPVRLWGGAPWPPRGRIGSEPLAPLGTCETSIAQCAG